MTPQQVRVHIVFDN
uniref:Uncharacterized protein n=1 Tax=Arundo donax TaxID=35708 RepID=A0A0A9AGR9_ARUDO